MKTAIIIPARYASTRLPAKPLLMVNDKPIIQYVYEAAKKSKLASAILVYYAATSVSSVVVYLFFFFGMEKHSLFTDLYGFDRDRSGLRSCYYLNDIQKPYKHVAINYCGSVIGKEYR